MLLHFSDAPSHSATLTIDNLHCLSDEPTIIVDDSQHELMSIELPEDTATQANFLRSVASTYSSDPTATKILANPKRYPKMRVINGIIYRSKTKNGLALYIPSTLTMENSEGKTVTMRELICYECHDSPVAGHLGRDRMYALISKNFYWPRMLHDINKQVSECAKCQANKHVKGRRQGLYTPVIPSRRRWADWSMDWIFKLPKTDGEGYDGIFVIMDL